MKSSEKDRKQGSVSSMLFGPPNNPLRTERRIKAESFKNPTSAISEKDAELNGDEKGLFFAREIIDRAISSSCVTGKS